MAPQVRMLFVRCVIGYSSGMHRVVRLAVYGAIYAVAFGANIFTHRKWGRRPIPLRVLLYVTGLMLSVALVEEFH
jgi:hypothetical protein